MSDLLTASIQNNDWCFHSEKCRKMIRGYPKRGSTAVLSAVSRPHYSGRAREQCLQAILPFSKTNLK